MKLRDKGRRQLFFYTYGAHLLNLFFLLCSSPAFFSCDTASGEELSVIQLDLCVKPFSPATRAQGWQLVRSLDIFVFEDDGVRGLDLRQHISEVHSDQQVISSSSGSKLLVVMANMPSDCKELEYVTTYEDLIAVTAELSADSVSNPVMSGESSYDPDVCGSCTVVLEPLLSCIDVNSIKCESEASDLKDVSVYLINVSGRCEVTRRSDFRPTEILCGGRCVETDLRRLREPGMLCRNLPGSGNFGPFSLYCYPNDAGEETAGSPFTRLVIEGTLGGERRYYPVEINRDMSICSGIGRNTRYVFDIMLSTRGQDSPSGATDYSIVSSKGSVTIFPSSYIHVSVGDVRHIYCETCPPGAELSIDMELLQEDADRGMHEFEVDPDGRGVTLHFLKPGSSIVYFSAGPPVNDDAMALVIAS